MKLHLSSDEKSKRQILRMLEKDSILAKFKTPLNAYALLIAATCYNASNIALANDYNGLKIMILLLIREMSAASIGVYGLAKLYYIFVDNVLKRLIWYFLVIMAAFNFGSFVNFATNWVHRILNI